MDCLMRMEHDFEFEVCMSVGWHLIP
jgi:hypothetical protein